MHNDKPAERHRSAAKSTTQAPERKPRTPGEKPKASITGRSTTKNTALSKSAAESGAENTALSKSTTLQRSLDAKTDAALKLFNTYLQIDQERRKHEQKIKKATKIKKNLASKVRQLQESKASASELEEAKTAYREAVDNLNHLKDATETSVTR